MPQPTENRIAPRVSGLAWMAIASVMFSIMTICARLAAAHASWAMVASMRAWAGVLVAFLVARAAGHTLRVRNGRVAWARSLFGLGGMSTAFYVMGSPDIALGDFAALRATGPLFVAILAAWLLKESPPRAAYLAVPVAFVGVVALVQPSFQTSGHLAALALLGAVSSAIAMLFLRRLGPGESPEAVALHFGSVAGVALTVVAVLNDPWASPAGWAWALTAGLAGGFGQLFMTRAYALDKAAAVSAMGYLAVVLTHLGAFVLLDEPLGWARGLGAALVILGGLILVFGRAQERREGEVAETVASAKGAAAPS